MLAKMLGRRGSNAGFDQQPGTAPSAQQQQLPTVGALRERRRSSAGSGDDGGAARLAQLEAGQRELGEAVRRSTELLLEALVRAERARDERAHEERKAATQRANELGAKVDAVLKELRHATKKSGWGQLTQ